MSLRRVARVLVVLTFLVAVLPLWMPPASSDAPDLYGWWYRLNSRQLIIPPIPGGPTPPEPRPPGVEEGAVYLGLAASDDGTVDEELDQLAVAAFVFFSKDGPGAVFELKINRGTIPAGSELVACPTTAPFAGEDGGFWENRPAGECSLLAEPGEVIGTNESVMWKLLGEYQVFPEYWSFTIEPRGTVPFEIVFDPPDTGTFSVDAGPGMFEDDEPPPMGDFGADPGAGAGFEESPPAFTEPAFEPFAEDVDEPAPVADETGPQPPMTRAADPIPIDDTTARVVATAVLAAMAAAFAWLYRVGNRRTAAAAVAGAEPVEVVDIESEELAGALGGIGRFARPRSAGPRRLV